MPAEAAASRGELQRTVDLRIDDVVAATDRSRVLRRAAASYGASWRDVTLFVCVVLFTVVWWNINPSRTDWLPIFIVLILL